MPTANRTNAAELDLQDIAFHLAVRERRPAAADRIIDELIEQCDNLAQLSPSSILGTATPEIGERVRVLAYKRWVILFRYEPHGVDILRFAHGSQDYLSWRLP
jgi:plasmid stabilization system protein ParE